jgi:hypothetical protein
VRLPVHTDFTSPTEQWLCTYFEPGVISKQGNLGKDAKRVDKSTSYGLTLEILSQGGAIRMWSLSSMPQGNTRREQLGRHYQQIPATSHDTAGGIVKVAVMDWCVDASFAR